MTQQPYAPAPGQQPGYPPQQYPQQPTYPQQPYAPQQPAPQYQQPYAPQQIPGQYPQQPPAQPPVQLADGGLDEFYSQPNTGGGPGVSWKGKPDGYTVQGVVPRDVGDGDVTQETGAPNTQQANVPQFYKDGRPKFVMAIPLQLQPSQEFPEGEARLFVRGQLREELVRAMGEAGEQGAPKAGAVITVTLVERKPGRGTIPQNIFRVVYTPAGGQAAPVQQLAPQPAPVQQPQAPVQQYAQPAPQQAPEQLAQQPMQQPQWAQPQQALAAQQPVAQAPVPQMPPDMTPEQQGLFAKLIGQQGQPAA